MANINLLPWREAQRRDRNRTTFTICVAMWIAAACAVLLAKSYVDSMINYQESRNSYLTSEINALSKVIREIEDLKSKRDALLARMEVIQALQSNRSQIVHVFDDLVTKLPKGVFYDNISKRSNTLVISGKAQSNGRVSALMRNLDSSEWFDNSSLKVVDILDDNGALVSKFNVEVKEERQEKNDDGVEAVR
jgi:type IV pilus assembly protein PilN